jgi:hypothetical protein
VAKKQSYLKKKKSFSGAQVLVFTLVFAAVGAVAVWQSLAAPHGGGGGKPSRDSGVVTIAMVTDLNSDGLPNVGDTITFSATTPASTEPHVKLQCFQSGTLVYSNQAGFYPSYPWPWLQNMTLNWASGAADCTATGYYFSGTKTVSFATLNFHVNP